MIRLTCSNCGEMLEVDDAFVGGVCRCQHCGTIQAVSGEDSDGNDGWQTRGSRGANVRDAPKKAVALYRREEERDAAAASGLDELADVVASSGIMSSGLHRHGRAARGGGKGAATGKGGSGRATTGSKPADRKLAIAIGLAAVFAVVAAGLAVALVSNGGDADDPAKRDVAPADPATFAGVEVGRRVVFVIDRGSQTQPVWDGLAKVLTQTLEAMPAGDHEFQLIFWSRPDADAALPPYAPGRSPRRATPETVTSAVELLDTVPTGGFTDVLPALQLAVETQPDQIFVVTGKASTLNQKFADDALAVIDGVGSTVHAVAVGNVQEGPTRPLHQLATRTGGRFIALPTASLPK